MINDERGGTPRTSPVAVRVKSPDRSAVVASAAI
jgi:hypothetical protein